MPASSLSVACWVTTEVRNERVGSPGSAGPCRSSSVTTVSATWTLYPTHSFLLLPFLPSSLLPALLPLLPSHLQDQRASGSCGFLTASAGCARRGAPAGAAGVGVGRLAEALPARACASACASASVVAAAVPAGGAAGKIGAASAAAGAACGSKVSS